MSKKFHIETNDAGGYTVQADTPEEALEKYLKDYGIEARIYKLGTHHDSNVKVMDETSGKEAYYQLQF